MMPEQMPQALPEVRPSNAPGDTRYATLRTQLTQRIQDPHEDPRFGLPPTPVDNEFLNISEVLDAMLLNRSSREPVLNIEPRRVISREVREARREADGTVTHKPWDDEDIPVINRHLMEKADYCNIAEWLNDDPSLIPELVDGRHCFEIGRTSFEPVWQGEDGVLWKPSAVES